MDSAFGLCTLKRVSLECTYYFLYSYYIVKVYSLSHCNVFVMYCNANKIKKKSYHTDALAILLHEDESWMLIMNFTK